MSQTIQVIPEQFKTSDGEVFDDLASAEKHEEVVKARSVYRRAAREYGLKLGASCLTADGKPFDFAGWNSHYAITRHLFELPRLVRVPFSSWSDEVVDYEGVCVRHVDDQKNRTNYPISQLYSDEKSAKRALVAAQRMWLSERAAEVDTDAAKWGVE